MKPVDFKGTNRVLTTNGITPLNVHISNNQVVACIKLTTAELKQIQQTGRFFIVTTIKTGEFELPKLQITNPVKVINKRRKKITN